VAVASSTVDSRGTVRFAGLPRAFYRVDVPATATTARVTTGYVWAR
jgi:hypothetical protein